MSITYADTVKKMAHLSSGMSNEDVFRAFCEVEVSYNAEAAARSLLGLACTIAHFRPSLLPAILIRPIDAMCCMGVSNLEDFWVYAKQLYEYDVSTRPQQKNFDNAAITFFQRELIKHNALIAQLLHSWEQRNQE